MSTEQPTSQEYRTLSGLEVKPVYGAERPPEA